MCIVFFIVLIFYKDPLCKLHSDFQTPGNLDRCNSPLHQEFAWGAGRQVHEGYKHTVAGLPWTSSKGFKTLGDNSQSSPSKLHFPLVW